VNVSASAAHMPTLKGGLIIEWLRYNSFQTIKNKVTGENIKRKMIENVSRNYVNKLVTEKPSHQSLNTSYINKVSPSIIHNVSSKIYANYAGKRNFFGIGPKILKLSNVSLAATMKHANLLQSLQKSLQQPKTLNVTGSSSA